MSGEGQIRSYQVISGQIKTRQFMTDVVRFMSGEVISCQEKINSGQVERGRSDHFKVL